MKYLDRSFSITPGSSDAYRDNFDRVFGKRDAEPLEATGPDEPTFLLCPACEAPVCYRCGDCVLDPDAGCECDE